MKLYSGPLSMFGAKAEIALAEKAIDFELVMVPFEMKKLYQPKHPEGLRSNPKRQVPGLVDPQTLPSAIAVNSATYQGSNFVGPAVAGILITSAGVVSIPRTSGETERCGRKRSPAVSSDGDAASSVVVVVSRSNS